MDPSIVASRRELEGICSRYNVLRLDLFGSAATENYRPHQSDLDFLVEFHTVPAGAYTDTYFGLREALERLFGRPIDLIVRSAIRNPYFLQSVEESRTIVYEA